MRFIKVFGWFATALLTLFLLCGNAAAQQQHTLTGDIRVHQDFHSQFLTHDRDVLVYLPPGYEAAKNRRYPVIYFHDGQNLFDGATSFIRGQEWRVDETAESLIVAKKIVPLIIVGIYNAGPDRMNEYTPAVDAKYKGGAADLYGRMIVEELKPFIDRTYRTKRDARHTGIGGSSLGGLVSIYLSLRYAKVFGRAAVVSPSVWFANQYILGFVNQLPHKEATRIWIDIGTNEGRNADEAKETEANTRLLYDALIKKGWKGGRELTYFVAEGAAHNEAAWAARVEQILTFLFPR